MTVHVNLRMLRRRGTALLYLFLISGALLPPLLAPGGAGGFDLDQGLPVLQVALAGALLVVAVQLMAYFWRREVLTVLRASALPLLFGGLALASMAWSVDPVLTFRRSVALVGAVAVVMYLVGVVGYRRSISLVTYLLAAVAVASLIAIAFVPDFGVHQTGGHVGRWKGIYFHKNLLGREMGLAAGLFILAAFEVKRRSGRLLWLVAACLALILIVGAQSATGLVTALAAMFVAGMLRLSRRQPILRAAAVVAVLLGLLTVGLVITASPGTLVALLGRDLSFTGRTDLWVLVVDAISNNPILGHGYRAFWGSISGAQLSTDIGWRVTHAHNSWLDVSLDLGLLGLLLMVVLVFWPSFKAFGARWVDSSFFETGVVITTATLAVSISDSVLLGPNNLFLLLILLQFSAAEYRPRRPLTATSPSGNGPLRSRGTGQQVVGPPTDDSGIHENVIKAETVWLLQRTDVMGGTKRIIDHLALRLAEAGLEATPVYLRDRAELDRARESAVLARLHDIRDVVRLLARLVQERPRTIVTFTPMLGALVAIVARPLKNVSVISTQHAMADKIGRAAYRFDQIVARTGSYASIISCAPAVAQSYERNGRRYMELVTVIANGVESTDVPRATSTNDDLQQELRISASARVAFAAGRLSGEKNYGLVLEALVQAPNWYFAIAGGGAAEAELRARAAELGVTERVRFLGVLPREQIGRWLSTCHAFVQPSLYEGLSLSLLEAMAHGAPCVVSDIPANRDPLTGPGGELGWLLPGSDSSAWAAVLELLEKDPSVGEVRGERARRHQQRDYDEERMYDRYVQLIMRETGL